MTRHLKYLLLSLYMVLLPPALQAQDDLLSLAEAADSSDTGKVTGAFKATRLVNGHSVETNGQQELLFLISHRFGTLNSGAYNLFGLDQATIRLALEYGITDRLTAGAGRSSLEKTYDGFLKYKLLQQRQGAVPVTLTLFSSAAINTLRNENPERDVPFSSRLAYTSQLLVARKFNERLSLQLAPSWVHRNRVATRQDENEVFAVGAGGRFKLTKRTSFNAEYYYVLPGETADDYINALSLGFDIETGGHVFQLIFTNAQGMVEKFFIPQNTGVWSDGDIYFGFNISRVFSLKKERDLEKERGW